MNTPKCPNYRKWCPSKRDDDRTQTFSRSRDLDKSFGSFAGSWEILFRGHQVIRSSPPVGEFSPKANKNLQISFRPSLNNLREFSPKVLLPCRIFALLVMNPLGWLLMELQAFAGSCLSTPINPSRSRRTEGLPARAELTVCLHGKRTE